MQQERSFWRWTWRQCCPQWGGPPRSTWRETQKLHYISKSPCWSRVYICIFFCFSGYTARGWRIMHLNHSIWSSLPRWLLLKSGWEGTNIPLPGTPSHCKYLRLLVLPNSVSPNNLQEQKCNVIGELLSTTWLHRPKTVVCNLGYMRI